MECAEGSPQVLQEYRFQVQLNWDRAKQACFPDDVAATKRHRICSLMP